MNIKKLFYDEKRDDALTEIEVGPISSIRKVTDKHISMVEEPCSKYIGHCSPKSGSAKDIACSIIDLCNRYQYDLYDLCVL